MKENILKKALELFFKFGLRSVSMDDISRELGISKKTLYQYFPTKDQLINDCMLLHMEGEKCSLAAIQVNAKNAIDELLQLTKHVTEMLSELTPRLIYDCQKYHRESWEAFEKFNNEHISNDIRCNIKRGVQEGLFRNDFDVEIVTKLYLGLSNAIIDVDVFPTQKFNTTNVFETLMMYHIRGIATPKGLEILFVLLKEKENSGTNN